ncbi:hypothetical protein A9239_09155 [Methanosarcina sp. A14]|nr:hypothetical protein A9239_09155 [Methanosarcina sp. A14]
MINRWIQDTKYLTSPATFFLKINLLNIFGFFLNFKRTIELHPNLLNSFHFVRINDPSRFLSFLVTGTNILPSDIVFTIDLLIILFFPIKKDLFQ